ncbi:MAG: PspA/IM30 family protein [Shimia sp.]
MIGTLKTILIGESRRAEEKVRDVYAIELIAQKIREVEDVQRGAKTTLATLIQRHRSELRQIDGIETRIAMLTERVKAALEADRTGLAEEGAQALATLENELTVRRTTADRLETKIERLHASVGSLNRKIVDLKQGEIAAKAARAEANATRRMTRTLAGPAPVQEAQELIDQVLGQDDPLEQSEILESIDADLSGRGIDDRMAAEGLGPRTKTTAADILARLKD